MPTGYSAPILDGITFEEYAMNCARAFGSYISLRDELDHVQMPKEFNEKDSYSVRRLKETEEEYKEFMQMSDKEIQKVIDENYKNTIEYNKKSLAEDKKNRETYISMKNKVEAWSPPTEEHLNLKGFMLQQIDISLPETDMSDYYIDPVKLNIKDWKTQEKENYLKDMLHYTEKINEEKKKFESNIKWIKDLRDSLK